MSTDNNNLISPLDILHLYKTIDEIFKIECANKYILVRLNKLEKFHIRLNNNKSIDVEEFVKSPMSVIKECLCNLDSEIELRAWQYIFGLLPKQYNVQDILNYYNDTVIILPVKPLTIKINNNNNNNNNISRYLPVKTTTPLSPISNNNNNKNI